MTSARAPRNTSAQPGDRYGVTSRCLGNDHDISVAGSRRDVTLPLRKTYPLQTCYEHIMLSLLHTVCLKVLVFFTQDFKCYCLLLEKNVYLLNFSFKFNEMKFYTMLMNWSIWEKILSYFYNKFKPVCRMRFIKCGLNNSLLTFFGLLQMVYGTLDLCFITTHIIHKVCV